MAHRALGGWLVTVSFHDDLAALRAMAEGRVSPTVHIHGVHTAPESARLNDRVADLIVALASAKLAEYERTPGPRLVLIESPYAGDVETNLRYGRAAVMDCAARGEAAFASHLFYTQPGCLDDDKPEERARGIALGHAWGRVADATVVYADLGISRGMQEGIERAHAEGRPVELRTLNGWGVPVLEGWKK